MTNIKVVHNYSCGVVSDVDISPLTWDDIEHWHVKWCTLHVTIKGTGEAKEFDLGDPDPEFMDTKRPSFVQIYSEDETELLCED